MAGVEVTAADKAAAAGARDEMVAAAATARNALAGMMSTFHAAFYRGLPRAVQTSLRGIATAGLAVEHAAIARLPVGSILTTLCAAISHSDDTREVLAALCAALDWDKKTTMAPRDIWEIAAANDNRCSEEYRAGLIGVQARLLAALPRLELHCIDLILAEYHNGNCAAEWIHAIEPQICMGFDWGPFTLALPFSLLARAVARR